MLVSACTMPPEAAERTAWLIPSAEFEDDYGRKAGSTEDEAWVLRLQ